ncbi:hypothetical protein C1Y63_06180 [Corynebacterium sp. 13CS0277]|uniref:hypothetical protein n=1 Tax=Corynebacterium sp. 13CS0277 TaxID=2071994 RepID=UPI000D02E53C|nr:hypothetical protein [Corynebacterium sp. 13CS0277]PRQ11435.1 hypothetical protein C1Y63_06180 [Corynebacterium sp. 13CS0277]
MALSAKEKERWAEIDSVIAEYKAALKAAEDHEVLKAFAKEQGWDNGPDFGKFKHSLKRIGVNYDQLREETFAARDAKKAEELADISADAPSVYLWAAAVEHDDKASFAIVSEDRDAIWYGNFFSDDRIRVAGDAVTAEQSVADKAVWLASKALAAAEQATGRLVLTTTCPHLDEDRLVAAGARLGVAVEIAVDPEDDRAVAMAGEPGYKRWQDNNLEELVLVIADE